MKLSVIFTAFAIALTVQANGADAIYWHFIKPFFNGYKPGGLVVATGSTGSTAGNITSSGGTMTNQSAQGLNNSNVIFASNANVSANISQVFNRPSSAAATAAVTTTEASATTSEAAKTTEAATTTEEMTTTGA